MPSPGHVSDFNLKLLLKLCSLVCHTPLFCILLNQVLAVMVVQLFQTTPVLPGLAQSVKVQTVFDHLGCLQLLVHCQQPVCPAQQKLLFA